MVKRYLTAEGHEIETAVNGEEGLARLAAGRPFDLIVSDIEMPVMDGWEFAREVRRRGVTTPMLALTSLSGVAYEIKARDCGLRQLRGQARPRPAGSEGGHPAGRPGVSSVTTARAPKAANCSARSAVNGRLFGVDILDVKEVTAETAYTRVAHAPDEVLGLVNIRGHIYLALDLRRLLGMPATVLTGDSRIGPVQTLGRQRLRRDRRRDRRHPGC